MKRGHRLPTALNPLADPVKNAQDKLDNDRMVKSLDKAVEQMGRKAVPNAYK